MATNRPRAFTKRHVLGLLTLLLLGFGLLGTVQAVEPVPPDPPPTSDPNAPLPPPPPEPGPSEGGETLPVPGLPPEADGESTIGQTAEGSLSGDITGFFTDRALLDRLTPDAVQWFERTVNYVEGKRGDALESTPSYGVTGGDGPNLFELFIDISWAIVFALFVYGLVNAIYFYRSDDHWQLFGRLFIAAALLWGAPDIGKTLATSWVEFHDFSQSAFAENTNSRMFQALGVMTAEAPSFLLAMAAFDKIDALATGGPGALVTDVIGEVNLGRQAKRLAWLFQLTVVIVLVMYGLHTLSIYSTGLVIVLAMLLLPVVSSLILLPGMSSYLSRWLSMVLTAFAGLLLSVIVYAVAMDLAFVIPLNNLGDQLTSTGAATSNYFSAAFPDLDKISINPLDWPEKIGNYIQERNDATDALRGQVIQTVALYIFNVIFIFIGMFMGLYLLTNFEQLIAGFLSGTVASGAQGLASQFGAAIAGGAAAGAIASSGGDGDGPKQMDAELESGSPSLSGTGRQFSLGEGGGGGPGSSQAALPSSGPSSPRGSPSVGEAAEVIV